MTDVRVPMAGRPRSIDWHAFIASRDTWRADPGLARDLTELLPDTTDEVPVR